MEHAGRGRAAAHAVTLSLSCRLSPRPLAMKRSRARALSRSRALRQCRSRALASPSRDEAFSSCLALSRRSVLPASHSSVITASRLRYLLIYARPVTSTQGLPKEHCGPLPYPLLLNLVLDVVHDGHYDGALYARAACVVDPLLPCIHKRHRHTPVSERNSSRSGAVVSCNGLALEESTYVFPCRDAAFHHAACVHARRSFLCVALQRPLIECCHQVLPLRSLAGLLTLSATEAFSLT